MGERDLAQTWTEIEQKLNGRPEPIQGMDVVYQFDLGNGGTYRLLLQNGTAQVKEGAAENAQCILSMGTAEFYKLLAGDLNSAAAYMLGKLKVQGSLGLALKLESLLKQYRFE
ncbi:MAG TPA: SCP2 sterol-binding domain-containing protein [Bacillaceae bacterium]